MIVEREASLAGSTTLRLGGPAERLVRVTDRAQLAQALALPGPTYVLGGGSNLVIADEGVRGTVVQIATRGLALEGDVLTAQAGEAWEDVVSLAIERGLAGIECLSGIPGSVGATPIQNVGAYGQEVSQVIEAVEVLERATGTVRWLAADECAFGYRDSRFKHADTFIVLAVRFKLSAGMPVIRYAELGRALKDREGPSLSDVRAAVRALRASKGMLIDDGYEPSAGSFFVNPIVSVEDALRAEERNPQLPRFDTDDGRVKLSAAWLIEQSGIARGLRRGNVGVSSRHTLALVNHGGSTRELLALAHEIRERVFDSFGIHLELEPVRWP